MIRSTQASRARDSTASSCSSSRGSVRWQWVSIIARLERRLERVLDVTDHRLSPLWPDDRDDVEPRGRLRDAVAAEVELGRLGDLVLLAVVDLLLGRRIVIRASFHLDEHDRLAVAGDDVDLAEVAAEVADDDLVAEVAQVAGRAVLAAVAQGALRLRLDLPAAGRTFAALASGEQVLQPVQHRHGGEDIG